MRIVDIRETAIPLKSDLKNSSIDFSEMTTSVVAVITDVIRDGKPVAGFAFNSTGRYACGAQMRARFIPRILKADPKSLLNEAGDNLDPAKILAVMMRNEKSGGHSERSVGIGTIEVAVWDAVAKIEGKPLHRVLAERFNGGKVLDKVFCYVGGGWYAPGKTTRDLQDEMRRHLDSGYTMVKMKIGGAPLAEDCAASRRSSPWSATAASSRSTPIRKFERDEAIAYAKALAPLQTALVRGAVRPARLRGPEGHFRRLRRRAVDRREPVLHPGRREPGALRRAQGRARRRDPGRSAAVLWHRAIRAHARHARTPPLAALRPVPARRQPDVAAHRRRLRAGRRESYPGVFGPFAGFADDAQLENGYLKLPDRPGIGFEGQAALYRIMRELAA